MPIKLTAAELQIAITALRVLRAQQNALALIVSVDPDQVKNGIQMVTDLETKLVVEKGKLAKTDVIPPLFHE